MGEMIASHTSGMSPWKRCAEPCPTPPVCQDAPSTGLVVHT